MIFHTPADLVAHVGQKLGESDWFTIERADRS